MYRIFSDGGSRGNPGPAAYAIVVEKDGAVVFERAEFIGINTNNYAEYRGLIAGISRAIEMGIGDVELISDSEIVIRQMKGLYKVKGRNILELHRDAVALSSQISHVKFTHMRRHEGLIPRADALLNQELDRNV